MGESITVATRQAILRSHGVAEVVAFPSSACPGALSPPSPAVEARKKEHCPDHSERWLMAAAPRAGGPYWPGNADERAKYDGREVYSIRVILLSLSPQGAVENSADYVFEAQQGRWQFLARRHLLIVE
jgi:hypothetical protein